MCLVAESYKRSSDAYRPRKSFNATHRLLLQPHDRGDCSGGGPSAPDFFRPKAMLKTAGIVLALAVAVYLFTLFIDTAGTGRSHKKEMIHTVQ